MKPYDLQNKTFGKLSVIAAVSHRGIRAWQCVCRCGNFSVVPTRDLICGKSRSCGCAKMTQGGRSHSREYQAWHDMHQRCRDPKGKQFHNYGGRGVTVCERWSSFKNFLTDMGVCPPKLTLEREENDKGYSKQNCIWATRAVQQRNTSRVRLLTYDGETMCITDWAHKLGMKRAALSNRLRRGWSLEKALSNTSSKGPDWAKTIRI